MRFYKRHQLVSRVCTTKMRELPADFEAKKALYTKIGAELIYKYKVPPELVLNGDETAVLLVNRAKITRNTKGAKRVKILGIGDDKTQITATIFVAETGEVLPYQMIFQGVTNKCHPKSARPNDCLWTHTKSHWQSVKTYLEFLEWAIVPYKNNVIRALGLPANQRTILKHDLHFTHKDAEVLAYLKANFICPLYVPAGCTDVIQECDVVVNKPFKNAVRSAFRDHLDTLFRAHLAAGNPPIEFVPKLTMGALKPFLTAFVEKGFSH
jgi:DDE superfamily endonuclease